MGKQVPQAPEVEQYRLEWLCADQRHRPIAEGPFLEVWDVFLKLAAAAPHTPIDTPLVLREIGKDGERRVAVFVFGWPHDGIEIPMVHVPNRKSEGE